MVMRIFSFNYIESNTYKANHLQTPGQFRLDAGSIFPESLFLQSEHLSPDCPHSTVHRPEIEDKIMRLLARLSYISCSKEPR